MSVDISCWDNIIGLSRTECTCYDPVPTTLSNSGLYLDELVELRSIDGLINCETGSDIWELMDKARENATRVFQADVNREMLNYFQLRREPFYGNIGRVKYTKTKTVTTGDYYGVRFFCADIVSGVLKIKKIGTLFDTTGTVTLWIYNNFNELLHTLTLNTTANTHNNNDITDIELPLHNGLVDNIEYFFVYQVGAIKPKDNDIKCSCGGMNATFNTKKPYFYQTHSNRQYYWTKYVMAGAYHSTSIADFSDVNCCTGNEMNGLTFELEFKCKVNEVLCVDYFDFEANPLAVSTALAIQYKAGEILLNSILVSPNLNRNVLVNRDAIAEQIDVIREKYNENLKYISANVNIGSNDCFECKDIQKIIKSGIMS